MKKDNEILKVMETLEIFGGNGPAGSQDTNQLCLQCVQAKCGLCF